MNCTVTCWTNSTYNGTSHSHPSSGLPAYVIAIAVIILTCISLTTLILVTRYCVIQKRQRSVTLTMRRARRMRRMEALHIDISYSDSDIEPSRCYTNLGIEGSPDDSKGFSTRVDEQNDGQTDKPPEEQNNNDHSTENITLDDHVEVNEHANHITPNRSDHVDTHVGKNRSNENDHITSEMPCHENVYDQVNPYTLAKPQPPLRFDFSDTESTTSAENWALVSASEMDFLTNNDVIMMEAEGGGDMSTKPIEMENEATTNRNDQ